MNNKRSVMFIPLFLGIFLLVNSGFASAQIYKDPGDSGIPEDGPDYEEDLPNGSSSPTGPTQSGSLTFSPGTVSNGQTFTIAVSGAPANAVTRIWVNNGDSLGFRNFGDWEKTNSSGSIFVNRTLNCSSYQTLNPGQTLPIGNKILTQEVYLEYVGTGKISPVASHSKNCLTSGGSGSPSDTPDDGSGPSTDVPDRTDPTNKYSFPGSSTYTLNTSKGPLTAALKFAPPIKKITFGQRNLSTYLGNNFQNIAWVANRYGGGPAGRWNISDPWNPKEPEVIGISNGPATDLGRKQPPEHRGPYSNKNYPHTTMFSSGTFADLPNGESRFAFETGVGLEYSGRALKIILEYGSGFGASLGQLLDFDWYNLFGQTKMSIGEKDGDDTSVSVIDATADGKFFLFGPGAKSPNTLGDSVIIYDITNLSGDPRDELESVGKILWPEVVHLEVVEVPGVKNHFLIARSTTSSNNPRLLIGEIDSLTGKIVRQNNFDLDLNPKVPSGKYFPYPADNFRDVSVNGKTYIFTIESFDNGNSIYHDTPGTLKIAAFQFNPTNLTFSRKGDVSLKNYPSWTFVDRRDAWNIVKTADGSAYPLLAAFKSDESFVTKKPDSYTGRSVFINKVDLAHYSLKDLLSASSTVSLNNPAPDFIIESQRPPVPMPFGGVLTTPFTVMGGNYHSFLKKEGETVNMYMYRQSLLWTGREGGDTMMPYDDIYPANAGDNVYVDKDNGTLFTSFSGVATLRIDKVDVSGFTGGAMPVNPNNPQVPPGPNNPFPTLPTPDPGIFTKSCEELYPNSTAMINLCKQINYVQERSCQVVPGLPFCRDNINAQY